MWSIWLMRSVLFIWSVPWVLLVGSVNKTDRIDLSDQIDLTEALLSESPEHSQEIAQCNRLVSQDGALGLHRLHRRGSLLAAFQDRSSEGEYVLAFLLDFALDHGIHRQDVRHRCARLGEMCVQLLVRVCLPGCLIETAV